LPGPEPEHAAVEALRARQADEDAAYAAVLEALDAVARAAASAAAGPPAADLELVNESWSKAERPAAGGLGGALRSRAWDALGPALDRQASWNAALVRVLNAQVAAAEQLTARVADLSAALVRYAQRVQPLVDARDRVAGALATTRSELVLETFDRRLESLGRRLDRLALREELAGASPLLQVQHAAEAPSLLERQAEGSLGAVLVDADADVEAIARAAHRALRRGGRIAFATSAGAAVAAALERAGFGDVRVDEAAARSRPVVFARR
jgi:hypothetical protein